MKTSNYLRASAGIFSFVSAAHLMRALERWPLRVGPWRVPGWMSVLCAVMSGALAAWGFREAKKS